MSGEHLVKRSLDAVVNPVSGARGERDARADGQHRFGFRTALGGKEVTAVERHSPLDDKLQCQILSF